MTELDFNLADVQPEGESQRLTVGKYLVRFEHTEKKAVKEKFLDDGQPDPGNGKNFFLLIEQKVFGGDHDGHIENSRLNIWNINETAVRMGRARLKSIFLAVGVADATNTAILHGKWAIMEAYEKTKRDGTKEIDFKYEAAPKEWYEGLEATSPPPTTHQRTNSQATEAATPQTQPAQQVPSFLKNATPVQSPPAQPANSLPSWAAKK